MKERKWRTVNNSYVYVDSDLGSDYFGDGTQLNPYQTLRRGYETGPLYTNKASYIVCRGRFSEQMMDGNMNCRILGDYPGAAIFDGAGVYSLYGFYTSNLYIINAVGCDSIDSWDWGTYPGLGNRSELFVGVGRAYNAAHVGQASSVYGLSGSSNLLHETVPYWGCVFDNAPDSTNIWSKPKWNGIITSSFDGRVKLYGSFSSTIYDINIEDVYPKSIYNNKAFTNTLFSKVDFYLNSGSETRTYTDCFFSGDCRFFVRRINTSTDSLYTSRDNIIFINVIKGSDNSISEVITNDDDSLYEGYNYINVYTSGDGTMRDIYTILRTVTPDNSTSKWIASEYWKFSDCVFSDQNSNQIFNNAEKLDFTLRVGCDAIYDKANGTFGYYGALPPAINIPFMHRDDENDMHGSDGIIESWDERTMTDPFYITDNDELAIDLNYKNADADGLIKGEILSKIIRINPQENIISGIYGVFIDKFRDTGYNLCDREVLSLYPLELLDNIEFELELDKSYLITSGIVMYTVVDTTMSDDNPDKITYYSLATGEVIKTTSSDNGKYKFYCLKENAPEETAVYEIIDPNVTPVIYVRGQKYITNDNLISLSQDLILNEFYYNYGQSLITYAEGTPSQRAIQPGESFRCEADGHKFVCQSNSNYKIARMFNESSISQFDWVPLLNFGEAFIMFGGNIVATASNGELGGSGNNYCWSSDKSSLNLSGSSKKHLDRSYLQFKYIIKKRWQ